MKQPVSPTHYDTLRLDAGASPQRVRMAYRRMAQKYHPDKHPGRSQAEDRMARINLAYAVLSDPEQRAAYDNDLAQAGTAVQRRGRANAMATFVQDRFGWSGWLLLAIASITVLTLGFVMLRTTAPARPTFHPPAATLGAAPAVDNTPLAPTPPIQPWTEPVKSNAPVNPQTEPVKQLVRDGVVEPSRRK
ncbi:MAG TPA: J domain-containing protein [Ramlibacter sp.]|nr:J domain-containing protein [Ramlibacter sp.]